MHFQIPTLKNVFKKFRFRRTFYLDWCGQLVTARAKKDAFSNLSRLVWTGPKASVNLNLNEILRDLKKSRRNKINFGKPPDS